MRAFYIILLISLSFCLKGQYADVSIANRQEAFLQFNRDFYLSGEKVWFSLFLYDAESKRLVSERRFLEINLVNQEGVSLWKGNIKVLEGRADAQFNLPTKLQTAVYAIHLGFPGERPDQYLYLKSLNVYNRQEVLESKDLTPETDVKTNLPGQGIEIEFSDREILTKEEVDFALKLENATEASVSIQIRKVGNRQELINAPLPQNKRIERPLELNRVFDHHYLQFDLRRVSAPKDSILPLVFIPEQHKPLGFIKSKDDIFTLDVTDLSPGTKHFYFNQFIYRAYIPPDLEWDYEKARYKDNLVPYYEGVLNFEWVEQSIDFKEAVRILNFVKPEITDRVYDLAKQNQVRELLTASGAYQTSNPAGLTIDSLTMQPMFWRQAKDYAPMDNLGEFLFEIVTGIKAWYTDDRKDIRVLNVDGPYHDIPLVLVNGVPTRDIARVLDLPIEHVQGAGVIKDHKSRGQYKYNQEALPYGAFASTGLIVIKLKPDVVNPFQSDFNGLLKKETYLKSSTFSEPKTMSGEFSPDLRTTLAWWPQVNLERRRTDHSFFTSDIPGTYEIIVQGVKKGGGMVISRKVFDVVRTEQ